jgi:murein endopeptidase
MAGSLGKLLALLGASFMAVSLHAAPSTAPVPPLPQATQQPWDSIASLPCSPESEYIGGVPVSIPVQAPAVTEARLPASQAKTDVGLAADSLDPAFCAEWNPDFGLRGVSCCGQKGIVQVRSRKRRPSCGPMRAKGSYCDERTLDQLSFENRVKNGEIIDLLRFLDQESQRRLQQSYCSVSDGFLAWGKPVIGTERNRIVVKNPERCVNYGTDSLISVLEWTGRRVAERFPGDEYSGVRLVVGNLSAPRGGCLAGRSGKRGHSSHTSGRDVDLALFSARPGKSSPEIFQTTLDPASNFWLLSQMYANPKACVKVVFLDKRHIRTLAKWALKNGFIAEWERMAPYIKHVRGHRNHIHVRVGDLPGAPGCTGQPGELDEEDDLFEGDAPSESENPDSELETDEPDNSGEVAEILKSLGAKPLKPQESWLTPPGKGQVQPAGPVLQRTGNL